MSRRSEGPFTQSRGSDGRFGRREPHHCHSGDGEHGSAELAAAAGLGAAIALAGVALYKWWTGRKQPEDASPPALEAAAELPARRDVNSVGRDAVRAFRQPTRSMAPEDVVANLEALTAHLRELTTLAEHRSMRGLNVHFDTEVWDGLMRMKRDARQACQELKGSAVRAGLHDFPRYRPPKLPKHRTTALVAETLHQLEHAMELSAWAAEGSGRTLELNPG